MERYQYIGKTDCTRTDCPVRQHAEFLANPNGLDKYRVYRNQGLALDVFGHQTFAACLICKSHVQVEKLGNKSNH